MYRYRDLWNPTVHRETININDVVPAADTMDDRSIRYNERIGHELARA